MEAIDQNELYIEVQPLGEGTFGRVSLVLHVPSGLLVALKE
jgi:serine/threonine protein kinase